MLKQEISITSGIYINQLKISIGILTRFNTTTSLVAHYVDWFVDCYLFYLVPIFSESINKQNTNPRKIYCVDSGIVNAITVEISEKRGAYLENLVFMHIRRQGHQPSYYKTESGFEIDNWSDMKNFFQI